MCSREVLSVGGAFHNDGPDSAGKRQIEAGQIETSRDHYHTNRLPRRAAALTPTACPSDKTTSPEV